MKFWAVFFCTLALVCILTGAAHAQRAGSVSGIVWNSAGAPVPGAKITLKGRARSFTATSNDKGEYKIVGVPAGSYELEVSAAKYKPFTTSGLNVTGGQDIPLEATLDSDGSAPARAEPAPALPAVSQAPPAEAPAAPLAILPQLIAPPVIQASQAPPSALASVSGAVRDQTGAVLAGAKITIKNAAANYTGAADAEGEYRIAVPPGTYDLEISSEGFKSFTTTGLNLAGGQRIPMDATLEPARLASEVNVEGETAGKVETETAQIAGTITEKEVQEIGLNGRNFTQLITLAPGVSNQTGQDEGLVGVKGSVKYSVNGGRVEYNTFDVDGGDILNAGINGSDSTLIVFPSLDAIQEMKVLTSNYGAQYGRSASGTILVDTKSGTRTFHGDAYEYFRNENLNARNYFDQTKSAPLYRKNDFGFTLGGPLYIPHHYNTNKDKTYFFVSEEWRYEQVPVAFNQAVPSFAERQGDFSDVCPKVSAIPGSTVHFSRAKFPDCPQTSVDQFGQSVTWPNNLVPVNPIGAALLSSNVIPEANARTGCNSTTGSCYDASVSPNTYWREDLFRIDHDLNPRMRATFRYIHDTWNTAVLTPQWGFVHNSFPTIQNSFVGPGLSLVARVTHAVSPTLLMQYVVSYTTDHIQLDDIAPPSVNLSRPSALSGLGYLFNNGFGGKLPGLVVAGTNQEYGGSGFAADTSYMPWRHSNPTIAAREDISKVAGKHTLQFGFHAIFANKNEINSANGANTGDVQGVLTFSNVNSLFTTQNAFADLLQGRIQTYQQDSAQLKYHNRYNIGEPYIQDDWRVTPNFTLNAGVRLSIFGLYYERDQRVYNWVPSAFSPAVASQLTVDPFTGVLLDKSTGIAIPINAANPDPRTTNGLVQCGKNGVPDGCMKLRLLYPAPRVGLAWDPTGTGKVSIRAGYGVFLEHGTGNESNTGSLEGSAPQVLDMTQINIFGYPCVGGIGSGGVNCFQPGALPLNITAIPTHNTWPYVQQWSLSVQREFTHNLIGSIAYVGSKGTHLTAQRQINQLTPLDPALNPFAAGQPLTSAVCRTFTGGSFLVNGNSILPGQPAYTNMLAACNGLAVGIPNANTLREFAPGFGRIVLLENAADSHYNALQFTLRRTKGPLTVDVSYSYSHSFDDSSDRSDATFVNSFSLTSNRASSSFDQRHLLNISYIYDLPHVGNSTFLRGWSLSGITSFQSGTPFSVINGGSTNGISVLDNAGVANGSGAGSYPDLVGNPNGPAPAGGNNPQSFGPLLGNPNAFAAPRGLTFGDAGRNSMNNPHRINFDMALLKEFRTSAEHRFQFRMEGFNVFNHTQFRIYDPLLGNTASNTVNCYAGPNNTAGAVDPNTGTNCLTGSAFLHPVDAHRARTLQLGIKYLF